LKYDKPNNVAENEIKLSILSPNDPLGFKFCDTIVYGKPFIKVTSVTDSRLISPENNQSQFLLLLLTYKKSLDFTRRILNGPYPIHLIFWKIDLSSN